MKIFEEKTRTTTQEKFFTLNEAHPLHKELQDWAREMHYECMPNDFIYSMLKEVADLYDSSISNRDIQGIRIDIVEDIREMMHEDLSDSWLGEYYMSRKWFFECKGDAIIDIMRDDQGEACISLNKNQPFISVIESGYYCHFRNMIDTFPLQELLDFELAQRGQTCTVE